jgi:hypothetical protein
MTAALGTAIFMVKFYDHKLPIYGHSMMCHWPVLESSGKYSGPKQTSLEEKVGGIRALAEQ